MFWTAIRLNEKDLKMPRLLKLLSLIGCLFFIQCSNQPQTTHDSMNIESKSGQVVHHVFFWLANPDSEEDKQQLIEGLNSLREIEEVKELMIGTPASTLERDVVDNSFQVSELMIFESTEAQDTYQVHPKHELFVEKYSHLWERVVVYDMIVE